MGKRFRMPGGFICKRGRVIATAIGAWLSTFASAHAGWTLQSSGRIETASPLITLVHKTVTGVRNVEIHVVFFDVKHCSLRVIDHADSPDYLDAAMRENHCLAGVNGNYFHPDRTPLGLVISDGREVHGLERAKLLSGVLTATPAHFSLLRYSEYTPDKAVTQALQAGPFLIDHGKPVAGLEAARIAERTVVLNNGHGGGALLVCRSATLAETAEILTTPGVITEFKVDRAMNLDGGSSTALWVDALPKPLYLPEFGNVRNYLALVPREK